MPLWIALIVVGVILAILGFGGVATWLIYVGVIVLIIGAVMTFVGRAGSRV